MTPVHSEQFLLQLRRIGQIAVVRQNNAVWRIDIKRLRFFIAARSPRGRIADLADAACAEQTAHIARAEYIAHHAAGFMHIERMSICSCNARGILTPVLQQ